MDFQCRGWVRVLFSSRIQRTRDGLCDRVGDADVRVLFPSRIQRTRDGPCDWVGDADVRVLVLSLLWLWLLSLLWLLLYVRSFFLFFFVCLIPEAEVRDIVQVVRGRAEVSDIVQVVGGLRGCRRRGCEPAGLAGVAGIVLETTACFDLEDALCPLLDQCKAERPPRVW